MLTSARVHHGLKRPRPENFRITQPRRGRVHNRFGERFSDVLVQRWIDGMWVDVDLAAGPR